MEIHSIEKNIVSNNLYLDTVFPFSCTFHLYWQVSSLSTHFIKLVQNFFRNNQPSYLSS